MINITSCAISRTTLAVTLCLLAPVLASANHPFDHFPALYDTLVGSYYEAAWQIHETIAERFPENPATLYARATILYTAMVDFEDTTGEAQFFRCCDEIDQHCREQAQTMGEDERSYFEFLQGSALATQGFYVGRRGEIWRALKLLVKAKSLFSNVIKKDPRLYDAYLGRGAYRWGVTKHAGVLTSLPLFPSRSDAFADMKLAMDSSSFSRHVAASALIWFLIENRRYTQAESLATRALRRFPNARPFLWPLASLQYKTGRFRECIVSSEELIRQYLASPRSNGYDVVGLYKRMANAAMKLDDHKAALRYCEMGLAASMTDDARHRRSRDLKNLEKWQKKARKRLEQNEKK